MTTRPTKYLDFPKIFEQIRKAEIPLPNFSPLPVEQGLAAIAGSSYHGRSSDLESVRIPGHKFSRTSARYFTTSTQSGKFNGTGLVIYYTYNNGQGVGKVASFAICLHHKVLDPRDRPNLTRGWNPGHCEKCGLDLTVDSGD